MNKLYCIILLLLFALMAKAQEDILALPVKHSAYITKFTYTSDKRYVYTASHDKTIKLWYFNGAHLIRTYYGHTGEITDIAVNNDNTILYSSDNNGLLIVWKVYTNEILHKITHHSAIKSILLNEKESVLLVGLENGIIDIYNTQNMQKIKSLNTKPYFPVKILPSAEKGKYFIAFNKLKTNDDSTGLNKGNVQLYNSMLEQFFPISSYTDDVMDMNLSPDSSKIITISKENNMVRIWDSGRLIEENSFKINIKPKVVFAARNNKMIGVGATDNSEIRGYRITGEEVLSFSTDTGSIVFGEFNKDITRVHILNTHGQFKVFDFQGNIRYIYGYYAAVSNKITASAYQPTQKLFALGYDNGKSILFNLSDNNIHTMPDITKSLVTSISIDNIQPWVGIVYEPQLTYEQDEYTAQLKSNIMVYDYRKKSIILQKQFTDHYVTSLELMESLLFTGFNNGEMEIWDVATNKKLSEQKIAPYDVIKIKSLKNKHLFIETIDNKLLHLELQKNYTTKLIKAYTLNKDEFLYDASENMITTNQRTFYILTNTNYPHSAHFSCIINKTDYLTLDSKGLTAYSQNSQLWSKNIEMEKPQNVLIDTTSSFIAMVFPYSRITFYHTKSGEHLGDLFIPDFSSWVFANNLNYDANEALLPQINAIKGIVFNRSINKENQRIQNLLQKSLNISRP